MTLSDIFVVCNIKLIYDPVNSQMIHVFEDIFSKLPVVLNSDQYSIVINVMTKYANNGHFPCTLLIRGQFVRDSSAIYADGMYSLYVLDLKTTNTYLDIVGTNAVLRDELTDTIVEIDGLPDEDFERFSADINQLLQNGYDFSKEGYNRISIIGNLKEVGSKIIYSNDDALLMNVTPVLISTLFNYTQRNNYNDY